MRDSLQSQKYQRGKNRLFLASLIYDVILLGGFFFSGFSFFLRDLSRHLSSNPFGVNGIYLAIFCSALYLLHFPLNFFSGFIREHKFHLSNQTFFQWLADDLKGSFLSLGMVFLLVEVIYWLLRTVPDWWWMWAGCFWVFFMFVLAKMIPNFIVPLFYKYSVVKEEAISARIKTLFERNHVELDNVYAINMSSKTKKANAMLCGMGKNRRVVLGDTLMDGFTVDEIESVVAHEIGHYKHHDILKLFMVNAVIIIGGLFLLNQVLSLSVEKFHLAGIADIAFLPMLILLFMVFGLGTAPMLNFLSCRIEREADLFSLETTKNKEAFISMMEKLGKMNLAEYRPGKLAEIFLYDHPPLYKRIQLAQNYHGEA